MMTRSSLSGFEAGIVISPSKAPLYGAKGRKTILFTMRQWRAEIRRGSYDWSLLHDVLEWAKA
jgi:hypothetical protein